MGNRASSSLLSRKQQETTTTTRTTPENSPINNNKNNNEQHTARYLTLQTAFARKPILTRPTMLLLLLSSSSSSSSSSPSPDLLFFDFLSIPLDTLFYVFDFITAMECFDSRVST
eukprot:PhM_4_TR6350/c0_g1_i2/m.39959